MIGYSFESKVNGLYDKYSNKIQQSNVTSADNFADN